MPRFTQAQLLDIFNALRKEMKPYEQGDMKARTDIDGKYELVSRKAGIVAAGKPRPEMDFAAIIVQSSYVGFYFMPIYCSEKIRAKLSDGLLKNLKGKACFHIKAVDVAVLGDIKHALEVGFTGYEQLGWV